MSTDINVISRTQHITVDPASGSVSVINAGPMGPGGPSGVGIPPGGLTGQVLTKLSNADYHVGWVGGAMSFTFGDYEDDDAVDTEEPEGLATSRIYQNTKATGNPGIKSYDDLSAPEQVLLLFIFTVLVKVHSSFNAEAGAILIITLARVFSNDPNRPFWHQLNAHDKEVEVVAARYILKRLARETGIEWGRD